MAVLSVPQVIQALEGLLGIPKDFWGGIILFLLSYQAFPVNRVNDIALNFDHRTINKGLSPLGGSNKVRGTLILKIDCIFHC